jgi:hypothetical protein
MGDKDQGQVLTGQAPEIPPEGQHPNVALHSCRDGLADAQILGKEVRGDDGRRLVFRARQRIEGDHLGVTDLALEFTDRGPGPGQACRQIGPV